MARVKSSSRIRSSLRSKATTRKKPSLRLKLSSLNKPSSESQSPTQPNHFMRLPRELRDHIYEYVFLDERKTQDGGPSLSAGNEDSGSGSASTFMSPEAFNILKSPDIFCYGHGYVAAPVASHFWGLEPMTRLLRVSHQIGEEAAKVLFSGLNLSWPTHTTKFHVQSILKPLDARARGLIQSVQVHVELAVTQHGKDEWIDAYKLQWKHAIAWLSWLLPGLKKVEVVLGFQRRHFLEVPARYEGDFEVTVKLVLDLLSPFQGLEFNALKVKAAKGNERGYQGDLVREIDARIQSGIW